MVVDDEEFIHSVFSNYLQKLQVPHIVMAHNGAQAFDIFREYASKGERIDAITMDINMPHLDGKTSAKKIREFEKIFNLEPCIIAMVSANCIQSEVSECTDPSGSIQAQSFLRKPSTYHDLRRALCK